ncbi:hypothetical protein SELMODRAFT_414772 [Selaginella moellendorffii]|uniref:Uncharacterized protein n=1 Tax=Selaginella moellendorffii TaxID=88036 RepID=D8RUK4_SELML|nr:hypothetical protein SELMODRAFT_414772 [Selaginella moellendorffii]
MILKIWTSSLLLLLLAHWIHSGNASSSTNSTTQNGGSSNMTDPRGPGGPNGPGGGGGQPGGGGAGGGGGGGGGGQPSGDENGILNMDMLIDLRDAIGEAQEQLQSIRQSLSFPTLNATQLQVVEALSLVEGLEDLQASSKNSLNTLKAIQETLEYFNNVLSLMLGLNQTQEDLAQVMASIIELQSDTPPASFQARDPDRASSPRAAPPLGI